MPRKTLSIDIRERILRVYDQGKYTQAEVAERFEVSYRMVKKLIQQRRHVGDIAPLRCTTAPGANLRSVRGTAANSVACSPKSRTSPSKNCATLWA